MNVFIDIIMYLYIVLEDPPGRSRRGRRWRSTAWLRSPGRELSGGYFPGRSERQMGPIAGSSDSSGPPTSHRLRSCTSYRGLIGPGVRAGLRRAWRPVPPAVAVRPSAAAAVLRREPPARL